MFNISSVYIKLTSGVRPEWVGLFSDSGACFPTLRNMYNNQLIFYLQFSMFLSLSKGFNNFEEKSWKRFSSLWKPWTCLEKRLIWKPVIWMRYDLTPSVLCPAKLFENQRKSLDTKQWVLGRKSQAVSTNNGDKKVTGVVL